MELAPISPKRVVCGSARLGITWSMGIMADNRVVAAVFFVLAIINAFLIMGGYYA